MSEELELEGGSRGPDYTCLVGMGRSWDITLNAVGRVLSGVALKQRGVVKCPYL